MKYYLLAAVICFIGFAGCKSSTDPSNTPTTGRITVVVSDSVTHQPIANATVFLFTAANDTTVRSSSHTSSTGTVVFDTLPPGVYFVMATAKNYTENVTRLEVQAGSDLHVNALMQKSKPIGSGLVLHVQNASTHAPISSASIVMDGGSDTYSDVNGDVSYSFGSFTSAVTHSFDITASGYAQSSITVTVPKDTWLYDTVNMTLRVDTLIARYTFNGSAIDSSGNGHNGTLHGCTFTTDRFGNANSALLCNGSTDYISVPNAADLNFGNGKSFTLCCWVNPGTQNPNGVNFPLLSKYNATGPILGYELYYSYTYRYFSKFATSAGSFSAPTIDFGSGTGWSFLTIVFDASGSITTYVGGNKVGSTYSSDASTIFNYMRGPMACSAPLLIGSDGAGTGFKGGIDDIRIYEGALEPETIVKLYHENGWR